MDREMQRSAERRLTPEERQIRIQKLKRKRRFRLAIVITAFTLLICMIICPIVLFAAFRVRTFTVDGTSPYTQEEIIEASGIKLGKSLLFADTDEASASIEKTLPYTKNVKITRKLPSGIIIRFEETSKAFAIRTANGFYALTNSDLKVLELAAQPPEGVALIEGAVPVIAEPGMKLSFLSDEKENDSVLSLLGTITGAIAVSGMKDVNLINISSASDIYFIYQGRIVMKFGDSSELASKISLGQRVIGEENTIDPDQSGTINLTVPKKAYFSPSDPDDIKELVEFNGGEWNDESDEQANEEEITTNPESDE